MMNWYFPFALQIGSSPGFEDGEFESSKFLRAASSFYHAAEDCLYIVDLEVLYTHSILPLPIVLHNINTPFL